MKPWAAVVRVSHMGERRAGSDRFHADEEQLTPIRAWAESRSLAIEVMEPELGVSGGLPLEQRPSLLAAIEGVERGEYSGIVVAYLSRLGRNVTEQLRAWDRVEAAGGQIVSIREGIDTSTAAGRLHRNLLISIDAHDREQHTERFEERTRLATAAGIWQRRQTPRGYRKDPGTRHLVPDGTADSVRAAFRALIGGMTIAAIARDLGMTPSGVRYLLRNRVYLGELQVGDHVNEAAHPPLVDLETFERVQQLLAENVRPGRKGRPPALLSGLARCSSCGHVMTRGSSNGGSAYTCPANHSGERCPQPAAIMCGRLDPHVEAIALIELARLEIRVTEGGQVGEAQRALKEAERELDAYLDSVSPVDVGGGAFNRGARSKRELVDAARDRLHAEVASRPTLPESGTGADAWESLNGQERNTLLRHLLEAVVIRPAGRGQRVPVAERARVVKYGADLPLPARQPGGIVPIPFPEPDDEVVLRIPGDQDRP